MLSFSPREDQNHSFPASTTAERQILAHRNPLPTNPKVVPILEAHGPLFRDNCFFPRCPRPGREGQGSSHLFRIDISPVSSIWLCKHTQDKGLRGLACSMGNHDPQTNVSTEKMDLLNLAVSELLLRDRHRNSLMYNELATN